MGNYRFDGRSKKQFERDIKSRTMEERSLFLMWLDLLEKQTGKRPAYKDTGCGKNGELLEENEVSTSPDFDVEGYGRVEVKFSKPMLTKCFHLKVNQVKQYTKTDVTILMINGADNDIPTFTMLKPPALKAIIKDCEVVEWVGFGFKSSFKIPINKFVWRPLK